ncbi:MAG: class I SAM-dependent methyltransferase [Verrucomicrobia bacterium]|nr:class I SAM-dependent methyltransferase [Verrucomicrobiota bacterium]MCH8513691.1 class I SAM-dependent methyltransferase [Kiritimatiellia bacterium]
MNPELQDFYSQRAHLGRPFSGQLVPEFQSRLASAHAEVKEKDCHFYHTLDLGGGRVVPGGWDIRGNERNYLGHIDFQQTRVLEFGCASGYLTFWMEQQGADVVGVDLPPGFPPDLVPLPGIDLEANAASGAVTAEQVRNSWWFGHRELKSKAQALYADIYRLPDDIGRFDVSTFGSILLHLSNSFRAMQEAARVTDKAMVVTDLIPDIVYGTDANSLVEFNPGDESSNLVNWWRFSPGAIAKMLKVLGFPHVDIHFFENQYHPHHDPEGEADTRFMFAAVGQRAQQFTDSHALGRLEKSDDEIRRDLELRQTVPHIHVENYNEAHRRLKESEGKLHKIYSSPFWKVTKPIRHFCGL